jgi:peptide/nickel transport system substrate-binding protein
MEKKNIAILILAVALVASGIGNIFLAFGPSIQTAPPDKITFVFGTSSGPADLDPVKSWDSASNDVIEQVCEGLYMYNLSDPALGIVPRLAADYGTWDSPTQFTVPLRRDVYFHDGTPFNADAVKWTFERINYFINASLTLPGSVGISQIHSLYEFPNQTTILDPTNPVTVNSEYSVTINLRAPYAIFEPLICYVTAYMVSPTSTEQFEYIDTATGDLVGTGPFVYDYYIADTEVKFHRWDRYWRTGAYFEEMTFAIIEDPTTRNNAMLGHTIDYLSGSMTSLFPTFDADATITHRTGGRGLGYYYLGMNNHYINQTWRQAISYAVNYTYIIDELQDGTVFRANGPLAPDFPGFNASIQAATYDLANARSIVQSMGFATGLDADDTTTGPNADAWKALALQTWNYT